MDDLAALDQASGIEALSGAGWDLQWDRDSLQCPSQHVLLPCLRK